MKDLKKNKKILFAIDMKLDVCVQLNCIETVLFIHLQLMSFVDFEMIYLLYKH